MGKSSTSRRPDSLLADALAAASAAYLPQIQSILAQRHDRATQYTSERRGNAATQDLVQQSVDQAVPETQNAFAQALATAHAQEAAVSGLGGSVEGAQVGAYDRRVSGDLAGALLGLAQQKQGASAERGYANQTARQSYLGDQAKITQSLQDVLAQESAAGVSAYGKAKQAQLQRAIQKTGLEITANRDALAHQDRQASLAEKTAADAARQAAKNKGTLPGGVKLLTPKQHGDFKDKIDAAVGEIKPLVQGGASRSEIAGMLLNGVPSPKQGVQGTPKVPAVITSAALDLVFDGHLSRRNVKNLHSRGYSVKKLGLPLKATGIPWAQQQAVVGAVQAVTPG